MSDERRICCCGASGWTRLFAFLQIFFNGIALAFYTFLLVALIIADSNNSDTTGEIKPIAYAVVSLEFLNSLVGFIMGIILWKGSRTRNTTYLQAWIIYAIISAVVSLIVVIVNGVGGEKGGGLAATIVSVVFAVIVNAFCIWVVRVHIREIDQSKYGDTA